MFVPPSDSSSDYHDIDDNSIDDNEYPVDKGENTDENLRKEVEVESVIIIVLATLLFTLLFFGGLILYYAKGKSYLRNFADNHDWPKDIRFVKELIYWLDIFCTVLFISWNICLLSNFLFETYKLVVNICSIVVLDNI